MCCACDIFEIARHNLEEFIFADFVLDAGHFVEMQVLDNCFFLVVEINGSDPEICAARVNDDYAFVRGDICPDFDIRGNHIEGAFFARQSRCISDRNESVTWSISTSR